MLYFQAKKKSQKKKKIVTKPSPQQAPNKAHGKPNSQQITEVPTNSPIKKTKTNTEQITSKSEITKGFIKEKEITKLLKA